MGERSDTGRPGAGLHHHLERRTEGLSNGPSSQGSCKRQLEQGCLGMEANISPQRRKQSPGAPDASSHGTVGSRDVVVSTSNVPAALHRVQVLNVSLTELLFLFSWGKVHFSISSCYVTSSSCSQTGKHECLNICCDSGVVAWFGFLVLIELVQH